jgi:hypothetical protein
VSRHVGLNDGETNTILWQALRELKEEVDQLRKELGGRPST